MQVMVPLPEDLRCALGSSAADRLPKGKEKEKKSEREKKPHSEKEKKHSPYLTIAVLCAVALMSGKSTRLYSKVLSILGEECKRIGGEEKPWSLLTMVKK